MMMLLDGSNTMRLGFRFAFRRGSAVLGVLPDCIPYFLGSSGEKN
jgi:hypothetical protein